MLYQNPLTNATQEVDASEGAKRRILERAGWTVITSAPELIPEPTPEPTFLIERLPEPPKPAKRKRGTHAI